MVLPNTLFGFTAIIMIDWVFLVGHLITESFKQINKKAYIERYSYGKSAHYWYDTRETTSFFSCSILYPGNHLLLWSGEKFFSYCLSSKD